MTETRIRWEYADGGMDGYVGTLVPPAFRICDAAPATATWVLMAEFPGDAILGDDMEELKVGAERWLERFVASLGAAFPRPAQIEQQPGKRQLTDMDVLDAFRTATNWTDAEVLHYESCGECVPGRQRGL